MDEKISIGIVDDDKEFSEDIAKNLSSKKDLKVVFKAHNRDDAIEYAESCKPQVILMDIDIKEKDTGIDITRKILVDNPKIKVIMLTNFKAEIMVLEAAKAGASDYAPKDPLNPNYDMIAEKIRNIVNPFNSYSIVSRAYEKERMIKSLTPRELEICKLIKEGNKKKILPHYLFLKKTL